MTPHDKSRERCIDTPMGEVTIGEKKWNEGEEDEHWAYVQCMTAYFDEESPTGEVVGHFLKQFAIAQQLANEGYELHSHLDDENLLWVNYTES